MTRQLSKGAIPSQKDRKQHQVTFHFFIQELYLLKLIYLLITILSSIFHTNCYITLRLYTFVQTNTKNK